MFNEKSGPRAQAKEATERAVLDAARAEFERVGFDKSNIRAIAARAKVSPGTVIHRFGDKQQLLHAALFDDLDRTLHRALAEMPSGSFAEQLSFLTRAVFRYYQRRPSLSRALLRESLFAQPPWAEKFTTQTGMVHATLAQLAAEAAKRGELREDVNGPLLAVAYLSFFYFALISWVQGANGTPVELVDHLVAQHLDGLRPSQKRTTAVPAAKRSKR